MTAITLASLSIFALAGAGKAGGRAEFQTRVPRIYGESVLSAQAGPSGRLSPPADQSYYQHLAAKRLRLLGMMTKARNRWKALAERLRAGSPRHPLTVGQRSRVSPSASIPHESGWLCIHSREGAWNANTGNGFYGGLQMTYGWMGLVTRADLLSPAQQMRAAETGYRRSGYSDSWMRGQWPNTYPPCAGRF